MPSNSGIGLDRGSALRGGLRWPDSGPRFDLGGQDRALPRAADCGEDEVLSVRRYADFFGFCYHAPMKHRPVTSGSAVSEPPYSNAPAFLVERARALARRAVARMREAGKQHSSRHHESRG